MPKVVIVVLNYCAYEETINCVRSIQKHCTLEAINIVIVDNGSSNDSYQILKNEFREIKEIVIVRSEKNVGFAKGNNIGIKIARQQLGADFVLLLNSDTIMLEDDYLDKMLSEYDDQVGVMQSCALRINGRYTQKNTGTYSLKEQLWTYIKFIADYFDIYVPFYKSQNKQEKDFPIWISGCDILLTPSFFDVYQGLYPYTFLYGEENILAIMIKKAGLCWKVVENAHILHAESASTPANLKEGMKKKQRMMLTARKNGILVRCVPFCILKRIKVY